MQGYVLMVFVSLLYLKFWVECSDPGPLILTPLLVAGGYKEAQQKALIVPYINGVKSYTGYFTVNKNCGSNIFFWFVPAENNWESAPVILWLNGGPGCSSLFGMFGEVGPLEYDPKKKFTKRDNYWSKDHNVIFLDQPVGTGFSFTTKGCYPKNMTAVAQDAYQALIQFFLLFPNLQKNKFFITGESFSGHYIPALAVEIDEENKKAKFKINLIGAMIGNPAMDDRCSRIAPYMYELGMVDEKTRDQLSRLEDALGQAITNRNTEQCFEQGGKIEELRNSVKLPSPYNVIYDKPVSKYYQLYIRRYDIRKLIHVGRIPYFPCSDDVFAALVDDFYAPSSANIQKLLQTNKYTFGIYSGQHDLICVYTEVPCVLRQLKWSGAEQYLLANRSQWYVGPRLAGWYKTAGNLFEVVVRSSGHFAPHDQSAAVLNLLKAFVADNPGSKLLTQLKTQRPTETSEATMAKFLFPFTARIF